MVQKDKKLNQQSVEKVKTEFLKEKTEALPPANSDIAMVKTMPEMTRIQFRNDRDPGIPLTFHYCNKKNNLPMTHYTLEHGKEYTLPLEVVENLEDSKIPIYAYQNDTDGIPQIYVKGYKYNFSCKVIRNKL